jgi:Prealbumin-like fold domain
MHPSSARSTTATAGKTVLAIVTILSLLLSAFAIASPVLATEVDSPADHCPDKDHPNKVNADEDGNGTTTINDVVITSAGNTLSFTNNNDTSATINWCAKGGNGFYGSGDATSKNTGPQVAIVPAGETITVTFNEGKDVSYFIPYTVVLDEPEECATATKGNLLGVTGTIPGVNEPGMPAGDPSTWSVSGTVTVPDGVCVEIHLTSYTLPSGHMLPFEDQVLHQDSPQSGTFEGPGTFPLTVDVPDGCYQADLYLGPLVPNPPHHGESRPNTHLFDWQAWQVGPNDTAEDCVPPVVECPEGGNALVGFHYTVNGEVTTYLDLDLIPNLEGATPLKVFFEIAEGCEDIELSLDSNTASGPTFETSIPQGDFDSDTGLFDAGNNTMEVNVPDCFYQVDFVFGGLLTAEQINTGTLYGDRKIDWRNGGEGECEGGETGETSVLEVDKLICEAADSATTFEGPIYVPIQSPDRIQGAGEELPADCELGGGVTFKVLLDANEDGVGEGPAVSPDLEADGSFTTNPDGTANITLPVGSYVLVEPATDDFPGGSLKFEIREDNFTVVFVQNDIDVVGSLLIAKEDEAGEPLGGAGFTLDDDLTEHLDTDADGFVCIDDLELGGLYDISETTVPEGYEGAADQTGVEVTVGDDCETREDGADATFVNVLVESGFVKVIKFMCPSEAPDGFENPEFLELEGDANEGDLNDDQLPPAFDDCDRAGTGDLDEAQFSLGAFEFWTGVAEGDEDAGIAVVEIGIGDHVLSEISPIEATGPTLTVEDGETVTVIVINFEEEEPSGGGGTAPGSAQTPRGGTLGGNPLPNTALPVDEAGSASAALLALLMLGGLGAAGYVAQLEARRRR